MRRTLLILLTAVLLGPAVLSGQRARSVLAVVPFRDATGAIGAKQTVMGKVAVEVQLKGFDITDNGRIASLLRQRRIRARSELSVEQARDVAAEIGARYVLMGSIDAWEDNDGPEVGLTARIVDVERGVTVWSGGAHLHAVEAPGLLAMARADDLPEATDRAVQRLFHDLGVRKKDGTVRSTRRQRKVAVTAMAKQPISYRSKDFDKGRTYRVAIFPLDNLTRATNAPVVLGDHLTARLMSLRRVEVIDPGELRRVLIANDIQPVYGIDAKIMAALAAELDVDAVLDGTILEFENGYSPIPSIDLYVRLRETGSGRILWCATTRREGTGTRTIYDVGLVRGIDRLSEEAVADLLSTLYR